MCDYSLHGVMSRPAEVGDKLITTHFTNSCTRGFAAIGEPNVAVCLVRVRRVRRHVNARARVELRALLRRVRARGMP